jgi:hypothetical protein
MEIRSPKKLKLRNFTEFWNASNIYPNYTQFAPVKISSPKKPVAPVKISSPKKPVAPVKISSPKKPVAPVKISSPKKPKSSKKDVSKRKFVESDGEDTEEEDPEVIKQKRKQVREYNMKQKAKSPSKKEKKEKKEEKAKKLKKKALKMLYGIDEEEDQEEKPPSKKPVQKKSPKKAFLDKISKEDPIYAVKYALNNLNERFLEAEPRMLEEYYFDHVGFGPLLQKYLDKFKLTIDDLNF